MSYQVLWDGKRSLHEVFCDPADVLKWRTKGSLLDHAPGSGDMPNYRDIQLATLPLKGEKAPAPRPSSPNMRGYCRTCHRSGWGPKARVEAGRRFKCTRCCAAAKA